MKSVFSIFKKKKNKALTGTARDRGVTGEDYAVCALQKSKYEIIERNFRTPAGEIDIVARDRDCLVFVEVRTRSSVEFGLPQETVVARKRDRLCRAARWYLQKNKRDDAVCRFDVVAIVVNDAESPRVEVIKDAFRPEKKW